MRRALVLAALAVAAAACARAEAPPVPYSHNRADYQQFRSRRGDLLEPNYLPFMAHRVALPGGGEALVFCRWADTRMPLAVHVEAPQIPAALQDEFRPRRADGYVAAVERALRTWEEGLEGLVRFGRAAAAADADVRVRLRGEVGPTPEPDVQVFGTTPLGGACRLAAGERSEERLPVDFAAPEVDIYLADAHGLLTEDQVFRVALHEIGHALGMRSHSPIPADLMFEIVRDRVRVDGLSTEDLNSFVSLYGMPNGTVYATLRTGSAPAVGEPAPPTGPPRLAMAPHVDPGLGYEIQTPEGWTRVGTPQGLIAVDGVFWDYAASLQVIVRRFPSFDAYLDRYAAAHVGGGEVVEQRALDVAGRRAFRLVVDHADDGYRDVLSFVETGDGRVVVVIADSPLPAAAAYAPWFEAILGSLEIRGSADGGRPLPDRDYLEAPPGR